jgi:hypothetical protein
MLKKPNIALSFKDNLSEDKKPKNRSVDNLSDGNHQVEKDLASLSSDKKVNKNCWSGYHVQFRDPRNFQQFAIDEKFNRWGDMVEFFKNQERPYRLSQGSLKDLLYGTYKRKGMHSLSLNDLVSINKIEREKITKSKSKEVLSPDDQPLDTSGLEIDDQMPGDQLEPQLVLGH